MVDILNSKYTYTTKFILPLLFKDTANYTELFKEPFINAYIADMDNNEEDDKIHLLFADYPSLTFQQTLPESISEYRREDEYVFVYDLPTEYADDYTKFLIGAYYHMSTKAKNKINNFWQGTHDTLLFGVLFRHKGRLKNFFKHVFGEDLDDLTPEAEWWAPPRIEREIMGLT